MAVECERAPNMETHWDQGGLKAEAVTPACKANHGHSLGTPGIQNPFQETTCVRRFMRALFP